MGERPDASADIFAFGHLVELRPRPWDDAADPWRADWVDDEDGVRFWCPQCWLREFNGY